MHSEQRQPWDRKTPLPPRAQQVYDFIEEYYLKHGWSPSIDEIGAKLGMSRISAHLHIGRLVVWGWVARERFKKRSVTPIAYLYDQSLKEGVDDQVNPE